MNTELMTILSQFGPAGLLGVLWILERRHATLRDRQLADAHRTLTAPPSPAAALLSVVRDNTRAIVTLEQTLRHLLRTAERLSDRLSGSGRGHRPVESRIRSEAAAQNADAA